jgi:hypothetical protein
MLPKSMYSIHFKEMTVGHLVPAIPQNQIGCRSKGVSKVSEAVKSPFIAWHYGFKEQVEQISSQQERVTHWAAFHLYSAEMLLNRCNCPGFLGGSDR